MTDKNPQEAAASPESMRTTEPGLKRLFLTLSVLFSFILGFPFLWKSVEIYRSEISLMETNPSLSFPFHFQALFFNFNPDLNPHHLKLSILDQITKLTSNSAPQCGTNNNLTTLSVTLHSNKSHCTHDTNFYPCGANAISAVDFDSADEDVDELLSSVFRGKNIYTVAVVNGGGEGIRVVVGKYRHAWIVGGFDFEKEEDLALRVAEIFVKVFVNGGRDQGLIHGEFMPVGADGRIVLSFNLLNAEPNDWVYDWDFQRIDESVLAPIMEVLGPIANISVESQITGNFEECATVDFLQAQNGTTKHINQTYVPSAKECPLRLQLPNGEISKTNGFISPMWGGAIVLNPQSCLKDLKSKRPQRHIMSPELELDRIFRRFLKSSWGSSDSFLVLNLITYMLVNQAHSTFYPVKEASQNGRNKELDVLSRQHTCFNLHSCVTTLGSLSRLVQSLPRMIIMDEIGKQVQFSLEAAKLAQSNASQGVYESSAVSSRQARSLAEDAFFHPSIMSVSYYSFEHCFAVYSPFFLPVLMHVLLAALREWRRYKKEKAKYLAWKKIK
ncbi:hypothetical protein Q3G72_005261 [Acer saccharum]|nr:hypothetical protein Q3G72_005261 [Acer saccharum]